MRIRQIKAIGVAALLSATAFAPAMSHAADYPVLRGTQTEDVPPAPAEVFGSFEWTGFYFGGGAGQTQSRFETDRGIRELARFAFQGTTIGSQFAADQLVTALPKRDSGATFFGFAGYNVAFGEAVIGIEGDYSRIDQSVSSSTLESRRIGNEYASVGSNQDAKLSDYFSARLRFGYAMGRVMPYLTVGAATGRFTTNTSVTADWGMTDDNGFRTGSYRGWPRMVGGPKKDVWGFGGVIGGGIEAALTDNLLLRAEYLYTRFDNVEGVTTSLNTARVAAALKF